jgi:hypothetical protein
MQLPHLFGLHDLSIGAALGCALLESARPREAALLSSRSMTLFEPAGSGFAA